MRLFISAAAVGSGLLALCSLGLAQHVVESSIPDLPRADSGLNLSSISKLANTGRGEEALRDLDRLAAAQPRLPGLDRTRGLALYSIDRLKEADAAFAAALAADPQDEEAAQMRGLTLFRMGRPAEAIPLLERSHETGVQQKADPTYVLALCYVDARRYDDARRAYAAQYGLAPESAAAYLLAARMLLRREYLPVALQFAEAAVAKDSKLPLAHEVMGEIALAQSRLDGAAAEFKAEIAANPLEAVPYERLGDVLGRKGEYAAAREALQRAVLLEPNSTGPYILLGKTTLKQGDAVAALTYLQRAERMDPANYMTHGLLAQTYRALGRPADAAHEQEVTQKMQAADEPKLTTAQ